MELFHPYSHKRGLLGTIICKLWQFKRDFKSLTFELGFPLLQRRLWALKSLHSKELSKLTVSRSNTSMVLVNGGTFTDISPSDKGIMTFMPELELTESHGYR